MTFYQDLKERLCKNTTTMIISSHCYLLGYVLMQLIVGNPIPRCDRYIVIGNFIGGIMALFIISALQVYVERKHPYND